MFGATNHDDDDNDDENLGDVLHTCVLHLIMNLNSYAMLARLLGGDACVFVYRRS